MKLLTLEKTAGLLGLTSGQTIDLAVRGVLKECQIIDGELYIPSLSAEKISANPNLAFDARELRTLSAFAAALGISCDTARLWVKLKKIFPDQEFRGHYFFYQTTINQIRHSIESRDGKTLKSRRNKTYLQGHSLYNSYLSADSPNADSIKKTVQLVQDFGASTNPAVSSLILAECALQLLNQRTGSWIGTPFPLVRAAAAGNLRLREFSSTVKSLIGSPELAAEIIGSYPKIFAVKWIFQEGEDLLGVLHVSLSAASERKKHGIYYTPISVADALIGQLAAAGYMDTDTDFVDPCCGSGNFLLRLPPSVSWKQIKATDIDRRAVDICRINMKLRNPDAPAEEIEKRIVCADYLSDETDFLFDRKPQRKLAIFGNPPWGVSYSKQERAELARKFKCATRSKCESFAAFEERSILAAGKGDAVAFVLPQSILSTAAHKTIRTIVSDEAQVLACGYEGEAFDGVACPCITLTLQKNKRADKINDVLRCKNATVSRKKRGFREQFVIGSDRICASTMLLGMNDFEYALLEKIGKADSCTTLHGCADWCLGLVTGRNDEFLSESPAHGKEPVILGSNVEKFRISRKRMRYIKYAPDEMQQTGPEWMYRAEEKIVYKFISRKTAFAYDDRQRLTLNSANIVIPRMKGLSVKYVLCALNSCIASFYMKRMFDSVKTLRSSIEAVPIKLADANEQAWFEERANLLIEGKLSSERASSIQREIDEKFCGMFGLEEQEALHLMNNYS